MRQWLEDQWSRKSLWQLLLFPISLVFIVLAVCRRALYKLGMFTVGRLPVKVIVVGNISVGGTGKTPLTLWLVDWLLLHGYKPGIISRGYGGNAQAVCEVFANSEPSAVGDESRLLANRALCPVFIGKNRHHAGLALLRAYPDINVIVADDGLQHYRLHRDVEIAVVDAERQFGNGLCMPAGPLRESISRLASVDFIVSNGKRFSLDAYEMGLKPKCFRNISNPKLELPIDAFHGQSVQALAGIGNPSRYFKQLLDLGIRTESHAFADHYLYHEDDLKFAENKVLLMTEKDAVKCNRFADKQWWYLEVDAKLPDDFGNKLLMKIKE